MWATLAKKLAYEYEFGDEIKQLDIYRGANLSLADKLIQTDVLVSDIHLPTDPKPIDKNSVVLLKQEKKKKKAKKKDKNSALKEEMEKIQEDLVKKENEDIEQIIDKVDVADVIAEDGKKQEVEEEVPSLEEFEKEADRERVLPKESIDSDISKKSVDYDTSELEEKPSE